MAVTPPSHAAKSRVLLWVGAIACSLSAAGCETRRPDAPLVIDEAERCGDVQPAAKLPELPITGRAESFFSAHPLAQVERHRGTVMSEPRVVAVFFGDDPLQQRTEAFLDSYGCTKMWRDAVNEYGIGDAAYVRSVVLPEYPKLASENDVEKPGVFEAWLAKELAARTFGELAEQDVLMFFAPFGSARTGPELGGYHQELVLDASGRPVTTRPPGGRSVIYAVVYRQGEDEDRAELDSRTFAASHELIEAATDPRVRTEPAYMLVRQPEVPSSVSFQFPFLGTSEVADLCEDHRLTPIDYPFAVSRAYSNRRARAGADPCFEDHPIRVLAALPAPSEGIDFSEGTGELRLDFYAADPHARYYVIARTLKVNLGNGDWYLDWLDMHSDPVRDGDRVTLDVPLSTDSSWFLANVGKPDASGHVLYLDVCAVDDVDERSCERQPMRVTRLPALSAEATQDTAAASASAM